MRERAAAREHDPGGHVPRVPGYPRAHGRACARSSPTSRATGSSPASTSRIAEHDPADLDSFDDRDEVVTPIRRSRGARSPTSRSGCTRRRSGRCCSSSRASTRRARTARSSTSCAARTRTGVRVYAFKEPTERGGSRTTSSGATTTTTPRRRHDPRLQPLALRGRAGRAGQGPRARGAVALALRLDQRLRAHARARGHDDPQVLPPHLARARSWRSSASGWSGPTSTGSCRPTTSRSASTGTSTSRPTRTRSTRPSTPWAPWYVVPADHRWFRNYVVARVLAATLEAMDPQFPAPPDEVKAFAERELGAAH